MSMTRTRWALCFLIHGLSCASLCACAGRATPPESSVSRGKYYGSGEPHYDEFFVALHRVQVQMEGAPGVPRAELQNLALALELTREASEAEVVQHLHALALAWSGGGAHLRLDRDAPNGKPELERAILRSNARPIDPAATRVIPALESSANHLLDSIGSMKRTDDALERLEVARVSLTPGVEQAFSDVDPSKRNEVKRNLADAQQAIAAMRARAGEVQSSSARLLDAVAQAVDTDDGSVPHAALASSDSELAAKARDAKKSPPKSNRAKPKPTGSAPTPSRPKPAASEENVKPPAPAKPAPRDFEP